MELSVSEKIMRQRLNGDERKSQVEFKAAATVLFLGADV